MIYKRRNVFRIKYYSACCGMISAVPLRETSFVRAFRKS